MKGERKREREREREEEVFVFRCCFLADPCLLCALEINKVAWR